jgi:hypothetical protein
MLSNDGGVLCNRCGLSCVIGPEGSQPAGLIKAEVTGSYESTPGNGNGALDDGDKYHFCLCEFCLDWLFTTFKIPVTVCGSDGLVVWRPAVDRMAEDEWRKDDSFYVEAARRALARG